MDSCFVCVFFLLLSETGSAAGTTALTSTDSTITNRTVIFSSGKIRTIAASIIPSSNIIVSPSFRDTTTSAHNNTTFYPTLIVVSSTLPTQSRSTLGPSTPSRPTMTKPPERKGFCARYNEEPCQNILNSSLLQYNETERYFDAEIGINGSKKFLSLLLKHSETSIKDPRCKWLIEVSLCQYTLSPCMENGQPVSFCREDCESLTSECKAPLNRLIGSADLLKDLKGFDFAHLVLPTNCSVYRSGKSGNKSCVFVGLFDHSKSSTSSTLISSQEVLWISVGAGSFLLFLLIVGTCCIRRQRRRKKKEIEALEEVTLQNMNSVDPASTMKNRISKMLSLSSLSSKIAEMYDPAKLKQFSLDKIEYISDLGEGQFGLVFKGSAVGINECKDAAEKTIVAVKTLKTGCNEHSMDEFNQEVALMSVLEHPNVVRLMAVATEEEPYCMIFEFMEHGDLNQFLRKLKPLNEDDLKEVPEMELCLEDFLSICRQVASGMSYLASLHFVHRDLASRNCLVGKGIVVKIADFGLARDIYSSDYYKVRGDAMLPVRWMPPEAVLHGRFTVESDVYSYGIVMWEVFTYALQPYYGYSNEEVIAFAKQGVLLGQPEECPDHIYKLMLDCWIRTAEKRPNFTMIIKRLVKDPPVSEYCTPRILSVTAEEPVERLPVTEEPIRNLPATTKEPIGSLPPEEPIKSLPAKAEQPIGSVPVVAEEPIGKIPVPKKSKPENHYVSPGSVVNCGYKSDSVEGDKNECGNNKIVPDGVYTNIPQASSRTQLIDMNK